MSVSMRNIEIKKIFEVLKRNRLLLIHLVILLALFIVPAFNRSFIDEWDNLLGGSLLLKGTTLYKDYFSHHGPVTYFIAAFLSIFSGSNIVLFKIFISIFFFIWVVLINIKVRRLIKSDLFIYLIAFFRIAVSYSEMLLADNIIALSIISLLVILIELNNKKRAPKIFEIFLFSFLNTSILLNSYSYIFISVTFYIFFLYYVYKYQLEKKAQLILKSIAIFSLPYLLLILYLLINNTFDIFIQDTLIFNFQFYSKYTSEVSITAWPSRLIFHLRSYISNLNQLENILHFGLLATVFVNLYTLIKLKRFSISILFSSILILSTIRGNIFLSFFVNNLNFHSTSSYLTIIFLICYTYSLLKNKDSFKFKTEIFNLNTFALHLLILFLSISGIYGVINLYRDWRTTRDITYRHIRSITSIINNITEETDRVYYGPLHFEYQIGSTREFASRYRFYVPWIDSCDYCREEILDELNNDTTIIVWQDNYVIWGLKEEQYAKDIKKLLNEKYTKYPNTDFYILNVKYGYISNKIQEMYKF